MKRIIRVKKRDAGTIGCFVLAFRGHRAVGTIIGGLIILSLILTALGTMVFVSQQYVQYEQILNKMAYYHDQSESENLTPDSPGLALLTSAPSSGWGTSCVTTYTCYNLTVSNLGGVGVQIVRIYINSTGPAGSGCSSPNPQPCIINPASTIAKYAFNQAGAFVNPGEVYHSALIALPFVLPSSQYSQNTVSIVTSRGNVFSFEWLLPQQIFGGQSQSAFSVGTIKIAYQDTSSGESGKCSGTGEDGLLTYGCDSSHDYYNAPGKSISPLYCHNEPEQSYPAPTNYAELLTFPSGVVVGTSLYFINPWITLPIFESARTDEEQVSGQGVCTTNCPTTQLYVYINITNTGLTPYTVAGGSLDITYSGSNHIDGTLIGIYYNASTPGNKVAPQFYSTSSGQNVAVGKSFYAIFKITLVEVDTSYLAISSMFWGSLSLTNNFEGTGYVGAVGLSSGVWVRTSC